MDLGLYNIQLLKEISTDLGFNMFQPDSKDIKIDFNQDGVDMELDANLTYDGITYNLMSNIRPGSMHREEVVIEMKDGSRYTNHQSFHQHDSKGIFFERPG